MKESNYNKQRNTRPSSQNLSDLTKIEQEHRHKIEKQAQFTFRSGQFFGFLYNIGILAIIYNLINKGNSDLALKIFLGHTILIITIIITSQFGKRKSKPRSQGSRKNYNNNRRYNNNR
ncbi:MAG: hypothetical protein ISQ34_01090 [Rickettsiales bacterium]|nr:hypothetical protein [Rickettsiales bacterium]